MTLSDPQIDDPEDWEGDRRHWGVKMTAYWDSRAEAEREIARMPEDPAHRFVAFACDDEPSTPPGPLQLIAIVVVVISILAFFGFCLWAFLAVVR